MAEDINKMWKDYKESKKTLRQLYSWNCSEYHRKNTELENAGQWWH